MKTYTMTELRRKTAEIVASLETGESVLLTHHGKPVGRIVPETEGEPVEQEQDSSPVFEEMLRVQNEILAELRYGRVPQRVVENRPLCDCGQPVSDFHEAFVRKMCADCLRRSTEPDLPTAAWDSLQPAPEGGWTEAGYTTDEGPEQVLRDAVCVFHNRPYPEHDFTYGTQCRRCGEMQQCERCDHAPHEGSACDPGCFCHLTQPEPQEPVQSPIPSERQLAYARDFYGLQEAQGDVGWALNEKGVNNALGTMKKLVRNGEELAVEMTSKPEDDPERLMYLTLLQIQKYEECLAKLQAGDPNWIAGGPSS
jgi:prevent-host-death family protein